MIRVFPRQTAWTPTDELAFVGPPPLFRPDEQPVRVSCTFTWDIPRAEQLARAWGAYYTDVRLGGPAFGDPGEEFVPGRFLRDGITITSRGCSDACPWCFVPKREGKVREIPIRQGYIVQDNNLLACSRQHIEAVAEMLKHQPRAAEFKGGLQAHRLKEWHREIFDSIRVREFWFACDSPAALKALERAAGILDGVPVSKRRAFVLMGFQGETLTEAETRVERVYELGFLPFAQLYQGDERTTYSPEWRALARKWSRPAAYRAKRPERAGGGE